MFINTKIICVTVIMICPHRAPAEAGVHQEFGGRENHCPPKGGIGTGGIRNTNTCLSDLSKLIRICMHTYIHTYMHAYMHACIHTCIYRCIRTKLKQIKTTTSCV